MEVDSAIQELFTKAVFAICPLSRVLLIAITDTLYVMTYVDDHYIYFFFSFFFLFVSFLFV